MIDINSKQEIVDFNLLWDSMSTTAFGNGVVRGTVVALRNPSGGPPSALGYIWNISIEIISNSLSSVIDAYSIVDGAETAGFTAKLTKLNLFYK